MSCNSYTTRVIAEEDFKARTEVAPDTSEMLPSSTSAGSDIHDFKGRVIDV